MSKQKYQYGTSPKKIQPEYRPYKKSKKNTKSKSEYYKQLKINEEQRKRAIKLEKKKHHKNVALIFAVFLVLLTISYRSSLINEKFAALQSAKEKLSAIEKTNGQLEVNIESSLNLGNVEESAKEKLGMQKLDNSQKVYVNLDKKDYVETSTEDIEITKTEEMNFFEKILNKIFGK